MLLSDHIYLLCHSACRFALADAATCAATLHCGLAFNCPRFARPAALSRPPRWPVPQSFIINMYLDYTIFHRAQTFRPLLFHPRRVHEANCFFRRRRTTAGSLAFFVKRGVGGAAPEIFFCKFLFFSSSFHFFFPLFLLFFSCCAYILPPAGGN